MFKALEGFVEGQDFGDLFFGGEVHDVEEDAFAAAAAFELAAGPGVFDEDAPHGLGGGEEELAAVREVELAAGLEAEEDFVDQAGGLERVVGALGGHPPAGEGAELLVDERE